MILLSLEGFVGGLSSGVTSIWRGVSGIASVVGDSVLLVLENAFNMFVSFIIGLIDGVSAPFGFKFSEVINQISSFIIGTAKFCTKIVVFFPQPFGLIFGTTIIFVICMFIYRVIRG